MTIEIPDWVISTSWKLWLIGLHLYAVATGVWFVKAFKYWRRYP